MSSQIDEALRSEVGSGFSGAVLVTRAGETLLDKAYGAERGVPARTTSRFWIASMGKQFVSAAILKCQEKGWLSLGDSIEKFFPKAPGDKKNITLKQLLAHQSGLPQNDAGEGKKNREQAVAAILAQPLAHAPGGEFLYSNDNYQLSAAIVEVASGKEFPRFVRTELLDVAGLHDTGQRIAGNKQSVAPAQSPLPPRLKHLEWGAEGWYSTTHDILTWLRALQSGRVLNSSSVNQLFEPVVKIGEGASGLGWFVGATDHGVRRIFTRGNEGFGPNALIYFYPDTDTVIIVLSHAGNKDDNTSFSRAAHAAIERVLFP
ncbi:MAG: beta-lactamase family protein [Acidobacteria bacterium]|nr:beta-lactamase family protein [Acidobacteriota bacterium]